MKFSRVIAIIIALCALAWILSGIIMGNSEATPEQADQPMQATKGSGASKVMEVRVYESHAEDYNGRVVVTGRTQASRIVTLKAEISGQVVEILKEKGARVGRGDVLARLDIRDRSARVKEARERVAQREIEYNAAEQLQNKGFNSRVRLAQAKADLETARAAMKTAEVDLANTTITAPFDGVIYEQDIEIGDFLSEGAALFTIVDLDPIEISSYVSEREIGNVEMGAPAHGKSLGGQDIEGEVSFIAPAADEQTRTFRVDVSAPNPDYRIKDGLTTRLEIPVASSPAHKISPAILALDEEGRVGVKIVNDENSVEFLPVTILSDKAEFMYVGGLPDTVRIITVGQDFVVPGQKVKAVESARDGSL